MSFAAQDASQEAAITNNPTLATYLPAIQEDIKTNDFSEAWKLAEGSTFLYPTPQADPLIQALESSSGLKQLDPGKQWTPAETEAYYKALGESGGYTGGGTLGANPYGQWGSQGAVTGGQDASANISQEGVTPDVERFAGAHPSKSFFSKYGTDIALLAAAVVAPEAIGAIAPEIAAATGAGAVASGAIAGAGYGLASTAAADLIGGKPITGKGELLSGLGYGIEGGILESGLSGIPRAAAVTGGKAITGEVGSELTSSPGRGTTLSPGVKPVASAAMSNIGGNPADPSLGTTTPSFGSNLVSGLESTFGQTSLGGIVGSMAPYLAIGGIGQAQAAKGQSNDNAYTQHLLSLAQPSLDEASTLQKDYNTGTLNKADQAVVNTGVEQGQSLIASAGGLSSIAHTLFSDYNTSTLKKADQLQLDQTVKAQKSQVAQQLASAGIADSTILAAQNQQIDDQALMTKQSILNGYYNVGNSAYTTWLTATEAGQQTIQDANKFASSQLQKYLETSMNEAAIGIAGATTAIQTQMQTDQEYAAQVSQLYGQLANAYAKQAAQRVANGQPNPLTGGPSIYAPTTSLNDTGLAGDTSSQIDTSGIANTDVTGLNDLATFGSSGALGDALLGTGSGSLNDADIVTNFLGSP